MLSALFALAASLSTASAVYSGFNYGSTNTDGSVVTEARFEELFTTAKGLVGTSGFTSARLYTMIQGGTTNTPTAAIQAAINTKTTLLLGLWASGGATDFADEITALTSAISTYGTSFTSLIAGISVGSEDLYRISPTGIENLSGVGAEPATLVSYIAQVRAAIAGTAASTALVGHVDTWTAWVNGTNDAVINACDFLGMDAYPYFQTTIANGIDLGATNFFDAYDATVAVSGGKAVWITETGWPVSGPTENQAVASVANAQTYWDDVACKVLGTYNTYWYTLQDAYPTTPSPSFGIVGTSLSTNPLYDLSCSAASSSTSTTSTKSATSSAAAASSAVASSSAAAIATSKAASSYAAASSSAAAASSKAASSAVAVSSSAAAATTSKTPTSATPVTYGSGSIGTVEITSYSTVTSCATSSYDVTVTSFTTYYETKTCSACSSFATSAVIVKSSTIAASSSPVAVKSSSAAASSPVIVKTSAVTSAAAASSSTSSSSCPDDLAGKTYQYPHLIIPVSSSSPTTAYGTSYFASINSTFSTIFNFDIPASYSGLTCTIEFLLPLLSQLETSSYTLSGTGGLHVAELSTPATTATTYATIPSAAGVDVTTANLVAGNKYVIAQHACGAGERISFEVSATGTLALWFFEDWNPCSLGLFITAA